MTFALNELESLLKKAANGAGFPVGHAVAIAAAGVWLARHRFPVCDVVARAVAHGMHDIRYSHDAGTTRFLAACAGVDGLNAIDLLLASGDDARVVLEDVDEPVLLLGLAGAAAQANRVGFAFEDGSRVIMIGDSATIEAPAGIGRGPRRIVLRKLSSWSVGDEIELASRYDPAACRDNGWQQLTALAFKTYVPASDQSRLGGAGAGLTDND